MGIALAIISIVFPILLIGAAILLVRWVFADHHTIDDQTKSGGRRRSLFSNIRRWFRRPVHKLDYRRDKKGRFRKVRRG